MSDSATLALALLRLDGVGRVTAQRLLKHFPTYAALAACPREQVLLRIKGTPHAEALVARLFDEAAMREPLAEAARTLEALAARQIRVLTLHDPRWPAGLDALDRADRPAALYAYGDADLLARPSVALFARPPLDGPAFETAQDLTRKLIAHDVVPAAGIAHGFDAVIHKVCAGTRRPSILVASAGMARVPGPMRPVVSAAVHAGGLLLSAFPLDHGPFPHDDGERALLQAALARAGAFFGPAADTPEGRALAWALAHDRPVFGVPGAEPLPDRVHRLERDVDLDWVVAAATADGEA